MDQIQKELATFPSVYAKDFIFFEDFQKTKRCGTYEAFTLGPRDAALFREPVAESLPEIVDSDLTEVPDTDVNYMKSIYRSDYKGEQLKGRTEEECVGTGVEEAEHRLSRPMDRPLLPLISSLRVLPGPPRYYHLPQSEFEDTISRFGLHRLKEKSNKEQVTKKKDAK